MAIFSENISLQMAIKTKKQLQSLFNFINFIVYKQKCSLLKDIYAKETELDIK